MADALSIDVFNSGYKPIPGGPGWDDRVPATWPASTSTLISGQRGRGSSSTRCSPRARASGLRRGCRSTGKRPRAIFVTHGHADHFFGAGPVLDAFPDAALMACDQQVVDAARGQTQPEGHGELELPVRRAARRSPPRCPRWPALRSSTWMATPPVPHDRRRRRARSPRSCTCRTCARICSGDIAYNNIHMWLWNSTPDSRQAWLASLDAVAALKPSTIITGHKDPDAPDDDATRVLDQSRRYIEDFDQAVATSGTPREVIDEMLAKYPAYGNRYTLFVAAFSQFPS